MRELRDERDEVSLRADDAGAVHAPTDLPSTGSEILRTVMRDVAIIDASQRGQAFQRAAEQIADHVARRSIGRQAGVDGLQMLAESHGLVTSLGQDAVQSVMARAFASVQTLPEFRGERLKLVRASDVKPQDVQWLWRDRIPQGKLTIIAGPAGVGKSQIVAGLAATISTGGVFNGCADPVRAGRIMMLSAEDDAADTVRPRLEAAGANLDQIDFIEAIGAKERQFDLQRDLEALEYQIRVFGDVRAVIIDPFNAYFGRVNSHEAAPMRAMLTPVTKLAAATGTSIIGIMHLNKPVGNMAALDRVLGSGAVTAAARSVYIAVKEAGSDRRLFIPAKSNLGTDTIGGLAYAVEERSTPSGQRAPAVVWQPGTVTITADQALSAGRPQWDRNSARAQAENFLRNALADGPIAAKTVESDAEGEGISEATLRRARKSLGIKPARAGGLGDLGHWVWSLPET